MIDSDRSGAEASDAETAGVARDPFESEPFPAALAEHETVFSMLASRARDRPRWQLVGSAFGGVANAAFFGIFLNVWWLGAAFIGAAAFGVWGLADAALGERRIEKADRGVAEFSLRVTRGVAVALGVAAAIATAAGFMAATLSGWHH